MNFNKYFDHTILKADATLAELEKLCSEAKEYNFASVCVNPIYVAKAKEFLAGSDVMVCTVAGFPLGATPSRVKAYEAKCAVEDGADEVDMVIAIGALKDGLDDYVREDVRLVKEACGDKCLKVIIETCLLNDEEKARVCRLCVEAGADFVKTSTGFSTAGATASDVALMKATVDGRAKVKAAGGIRDAKTAHEMIKAGADRIGASRTVDILSQM